MFGFLPGKDSARASRDAGPGVKRLEPLKITKVRAILTAPAVRPTWSSRWKPVSRGFMVGRRQLPAASAGGEKPPSRNTSTHSARRDPDNIEDIWQTARTAPTGATGRSEQPWAEWTCSLGHQRQARGLPSVNCWAQVPVRRALLWSRGGRTLDG